MPETRNGNFLIEVKGGAKAVDVVRSEVEKSLGPGVFVRSLEQRRLIELVDIDCVTTKEEIVKAFIRNFGT